jgi:hypothetical protein
MSNRSPVDTPQEKEYPFKQRGWLPGHLNPRRLLSLFQMLEVGAYGYIDVGVAIQSISENLTVSLAPEEILTDAAKAEVHQALLTILGHCGTGQLNLAVCRNLTKRFLDTYEKQAPTYGQARDDIRVLKLALEAELDTRLFLFVPPERADYYTQEPWPPWEDVGFIGKMEPFRAVEKAFPSTRYDLEEAGDCFALARYTASVFHLMRVMEAGLKTVAKALGIAYSSNWGRCLAEIDKQGQQSEPFFAEAATYLKSVKNVWRNPTMHVERMYSEQEAERIFNAVQAFMQHLASRLTE